MGLQSIFAPFTRLLHFLGMISAIQALAKLPRLMNTNLILIADDDLEDQEMLIEELAKLEEELSIETASNGQEALSKLTRLADMELPALIVLDYKMPYMNAAEVLEALAKEERYAPVPKVVWSSSHRADDVRRCLQAGACYYFEKPATTAKLEEIARQMLGYRQANEFRRADPYADAGI